MKHEARAGISDNQGYNAIHYAALKGHRLALEMVNHFYHYLSLGKIFFIKFKKAEQSYSLSKKNILIV